MRILMCGDRHWDDERTIRAVLEGLGPDTVIIEGEAPGADTMARQVAEDFDMTVLKFPADWTRYGRAAGPIRNEQMLREGRPDLVIAFHHDISQSKGTANMIRKAGKAGINYVVVAGHQDVAVAREHIGVIVDT